MFTPLTFSEKHFKEGIVYYTVKLEALVSGWGVF